MKIIINILNFLGQRHFFNSRWLFHFVHFVLKNILKYRKKIILQNLKNAFAEKSIQEIKHLLDKYYLHLTTIFLETFDSFYLEKNEINNKVFFKVDTDVEKLLKDNKTFIFTSGHSGNWELVNLAMSINFKQEIRAIFQPISNKYFDEFIKEKRSRFGTKMYPKVKSIAEEILNDNQNSFALALINDQSPKPELAYWTTFLNQETGFYRGPAELALKYDLPLVFMHVHRLDNGNYEVISELIQNRNSVEEMLEEYVLKLEENIKKDPANWLWSHRRWKHKKPFN